MTFLPDGRILVTEMAGALRLHDLEGGDAEGWLLKLTPPAAGQPGTDT